MSNRVQWEPGHTVESEMLDEQHKSILAQCNVLADCLDNAGEEGDRTFDKVLENFMPLAREHYAVEEAQLARSSYPMIEEHRNEQGEFEYLAAEIITNENFDRDELQTFLSLWWTGHIVGSAKKQRAWC